MNGGLLWVNKDSSSTHLSRSSKAETARIRAHVQHLSIQSRQRRKSAPPPRTTRTSSKSVSEDECSTPADIEWSENEPTEDEIKRLPKQTQDSWILPSSVLTWLPGATSEEKRSFLFFLRRTAQEWSGYRDVSFWNVLVPQASAAHQSIFHSVTALGALHESLELNNDPNQEANLQQLLWQRTSRMSIK